MSIILTVAGLVFELVGVLIMICAPLSDVQLKKFAVGDFLVSKRTALFLPFMSLLFICNILIRVYDTLFWPWLLWFSAILFVACSFPLIVSCAMKYVSWGVDTPKNYARIFRFQSVGLVILSLGFILQTLGSALSSYIK